MKYLSLFSGIGGFELGIQQAYEICNADRNKERGVKENTSGNKRQRLLTTQGQDISAEKRPTRKRIADKPHERPLCVGYSEIDKYAVQIYENHFPTHQNFHDITKISAEILPDFDLLCGGFPCQSFSIAGKREGFNDTRGTLFFDIARILKAKQPRLCLLENVKGLLSHDNGKTFATIINTLDELGYDLQWQVLNSKNFGVPQNRERVFIVGHLRGTPRPKVFPFGESNENNIVQLNTPTHSNDRIYGSEGLSPTLNTAQGGRRQPKIAPTIRANHHNTADVHFIANTLDANYAKGDNRPNNKSGRTRIFEGLKIRRLTPLECERLQGFPDNWTEGISDSQRYKCCGNAVTVNVIQAIIEKLSPYTLDHCNR